MAENYKRLTLFAGHYGSGKTNLAVNYALALRRSGKKVRIADLDIVNPYFRTKDSAEELAAAGIELVSPTYANTNLDIPALPQEMYGLFERRDSCAVIDVGGDDAGAYALGRFAPLILEENDYEMIFTVNFYRPLTPDAESALEVMRRAGSQALGAERAARHNDGGEGGYLRRYQGREALPSQAAKEIFLT